MSDPAAGDRDAAEATVAKLAFGHRGRPSVPDGTPEEIRDRIIWEPRRPVDLDPLIPSVGSRPRRKHRLVVLGDSISHGFKSLAIRDTELSWPKLVARYGGLGQFKVPWYDGPDVAPGLPFNLEAAIRALQWPGAALDPRALRVLPRLRDIMDEVEDYWERGDGAVAVEGSCSGARQLDRVNHNLAIWGQDIRDALSLDVATLQDRVSRARHRGDNGLVQFASAHAERSALITLEGGGPTDTPVRLAKALGEDGGIETLVVGLGANNILSTVLDFDIAWTQDDDYADLEAKRAYTAWTPEHFRVEYDALIREVETIAAEYVLVFTVPHVTIVPMLRGVGPKMAGDRYFARYTRPWIPDDAFSANVNPCLTGEQVRVLDFAVDLYNDHICRRVAELDDPAGRRWAVVDVAGILDRLAYRRYLIDSEAQPSWWTPYDLPDEYRQLSPIPDSRYFRSDRFGRCEGGLFALDAVHPTTIGYGLLAREVMRAMSALGVHLARPEPDFAELIERDTLISDPPRMLSSVLTAVGSANHLVDLFQAVRHGRPV
ncbi:hypothetical protein [Microlunatus ginsengisoli]|uniref:GDSL-like Lipase/Acylhydrolase n=1 Tax=Microlunatus ginsengisoli TaxID=363863 RepID=A0ABP7AHV8_9ACTN